MSRLYALQLLEQAARNPECDELFRRIEWPPPDEWRAVVERWREARASWGTVEEDLG